MKRQRPDFDIATCWRLEATPEELTRIVLDPALIHLWCPSVFMDSDVIDRGRPDGLGMTVAVHSKGWLPHSFVCIARIVDLVPHRYMKIAVSGDFEGSGSMTVDPLGDGYCEARLHWRTDVNHSYVKYFKRALRPVFIWNHEWAMRNANRLIQLEVYRRRACLGDFPAVGATFPHNLRFFREWAHRRTAS